MLNILRESIFNDIGKGQEGSDTTQLAFSLTMFAYL